MWRASSAMGLQYALLFACVIATMVWPTTERWAPTFHWTRNMTIKNPENRPTFNYADLGPLQDAWQVLEETSNNAYFLMFRTQFPL
uniref:Putative salivary lipocalin n=1 Tax=Ixodes ricinus TaxID=34613 RepID=A0A0K8R6G0_IXORI